MRLLLEVLASSMEVAKFPNRRTGQVEETPFLQVVGVDQDYFDSLLKVKIFRPKDLNKRFSKGQLLQVKYRQAKYSDFEKSVVINANESDVVLHQNGAGQAEPVPAMAA